MFSSKTKAERTASQAWDYLSSAMTTAGDSAREVGGQTADAAARFADQANKLADQAGKHGQKLAEKADKRGHKLAEKANQRGSALVDLANDKSAALAGVASAKADVAWARASAAADALAGRRHRPWGLIIGATLLGGAVGFAVAGALRAAQERAAEDGELEAADNAVIVTPSFDD
jgi:hypothetical protein